MRKKKLAWIGGIGAVLLTGFVLVGLDSRLVVRTYQLSSDKLTQAVRLVLLTDLHSCSYGEGQRALTDLVLEQEADLVLLGGDWVDDEVSRLDPERAYTVARTLAEHLPVYYVTGNHEFWGGEVETIRRTLAQCGVVPLSGTSVTHSVYGQSIQICGIDDPMVGEAEWQRQLAQAAQGEKDLFRILLTHRPERTEAYAQAGFDLVLAGHAHGGQWRIPGLLNGLLAPNQGFFPAHAGGCYPLGEREMIVSRGLARESTRVPRFYNPPEVVVIDLLPQT